MSAQTGAFAYGDLSNREDLWDDIKDLDPLETWMSTHCGTVPVYNVIHSWPIDGITAETTQTGTVELDDTSYAATNPTILLNVTQIIEKGVAVSMSNMNTKHAGFKDKWAREKLKAMKLFKDQLELSIVAGAMTTGTGTAARKMQGIAGFASTLATVAAASGTSLTSAIFNGILGDAYSAGQDHDTVLVGRKLKETISLFTAGNTKNVPASEATIYDRVDVYDSDHGRQEIIKHRKVDYISGTTAGTHTLVTCIRDFISIGVMDEVHYEDRDRSGYYKKGAIVGEYTVQVANEKAVSCMTHLQ